MPVPTVVMKHTFEKFSISINNNTCVLKPWWFESLRSWSVWSRQTGANKNIVSTSLWYKPLARPEQVLGAMPSANLPIDTSTLSPISTQVRCHDTKHEQWEQRIIIADRTEAGQLEADRLVLTKILLAQVCGTNLSLVRSKFLAPCPAPIYRLTHQH